MPFDPSSPTAPLSGDRSCAVATSFEVGHSRQRAWGRPPLLAACGGDDDGGTPAGGDGAYPLARPDAPVTLPIFDDNQPIAAGQEPEKVDALRVLNYADYMAPGVKKDFQKKYGAEVQVTPYNNYDEMLTKISAPGAEFDVVFPGPSVMSRMVYGTAAPAVPAVVPDQSDERLARVPGPVVRPRLAVQRPLHRVHQRSRLPLRHRDRPV